MLQSKGLGKENLPYTMFTAGTSVFYNTSRFIAVFSYLHQVIDETLRCAVVAPMAARFQDFDSELGGHKIPKNVSDIYSTSYRSKNVIHGHNWYVNIG